MAASSCCPGRSSWPPGAATAAPTRSASSGSCLTQDFDGAVRSFQAALKLVPNDVRLHQNLALTYELKGDLAQADPHWNRYFDLLGDQMPAPPDLPRYLDNLAYESLSRLA